MRAIRARYDPYSQAKGRIAQLRNIGHEVDKVVSEQKLTNKIICVLIFVN
jgi:hypothetical protein